MSAKKKTPAKTPARRKRKKKPVGLVVQAHGGSIHQGPPTNPVAGPGRPRSVIRDTMAASFDQRIPVLEAIADGEAVRELQVGIAALLPHLACLKCGVPVLAASVDDLFVTVQGKTSASPKDRVASLSLLFAGGVGPRKEISLDVIKERLKAQNAVIRSELDQATSTRLLAALGRVWRGD